MIPFLKPEQFRFVELRRRLLETYPDLDDQTLADTLEGATDFKEALAAVIRSALDDEMLADALKERIETMRERLARFEARSANKRLAALEAMEEAGLRKVAEADFTASVRLGPPSVAISAEGDLPIEYLVPQAAKPDRRAILAALTAGGFVPGAELAEPKISLSIRSA
jgi:uncharacterized protein YutE (UPF0331/DUF86 family)